MLLGSGGDEAVDGMLGLGEVSEDEVAAEGNMLALLGEGVVPQGLIQIDGFALDHVVPVSNGVGYGTAQSQYSDDDEDDHACPELTCCSAFGFDFCCHEIPLF